MWPTYTPNVVETFSESYPSWNETSFSKAAALHAKPYPNMIEKYSSHSVIAAPQSCVSRRFQKMKRMRKFWEACAALATQKNCLNPRTELHFENGSRGEGKSGLLH